MAIAAVCFKAVVLLLFIHCILLLSLFVGVLCKALLLLCGDLCPFILLAKRCSASSVYIPSSINIVNIIRNMLPSIRYPLLGHLY